MEFSKNRVFLSGIVAGMVLVFLFSQPFVFRGVILLRSYVYDWLPTSVAQFLWDQTLLAITFFWAMIFVGLIIWLVRGDFFALEDHPASGESRDPFGDQRDNDGFR